MGINKKQYGAVSLFVVVFAALLITIVTLSFARSMIKDQQQASTVDLSQSGYDSAQAGVEDAKRALLRYQDICGTAADKNACADQSNVVISSQVCNEAVSKLDGINFGVNEIKVAQTSADSSLDQAYTCVKINLNTDDYIGTLAQDSSKMIPLLGMGDFNKITIDWFSVKDLQGVSLSVNVPSASAGTPLLTQSNWTSALTPNRPPIIRSQLFQFSNTNGFNLTDLDNNTANASSNTLFLYPSDIPEIQRFTNDIRKSYKTATRVLCNPSLSSSVYSCSATIDLPATIKIGDRTAYLNLAAIYKKTNYRVRLFNGVNLVQFNGVQPEVDSTGRANDLFRRVKSRVELSDINFPYPYAAVDISGNLCKDFRVSDDPNDYVTNCQP